MTNADPKTAITVIRDRMTTVELGEKIGISPQAVGQWKKVPAARVLEVERATGIPREQLRPDLYGAPLPPMETKGEAA